MYNPLYNDVFAYVKETLDTRAKSYLNDDPKKGYTNTTWAHGKLAYCYVESLCDEDSTNSGKVLARIGHVNENLGGYGSFKSDQFEHETMYRTDYYGNNKDAQSLSRFIKDDGLKTELQQRFKDAKYGRGNIPAIPQLTAVSITNEGKMGSLQKVNFSFTVQDVTQFDLYEELFMRPGRELRVKYGWNVSAREDNENSIERANEKINCADYDVFRGIVYNCSWTINSDLGYDCTVDVVGEGFFSINAESTVVADDGGTYKDGNYELKQMDLKSQLLGDIASFEKNDQTPPEEGEYILGNLTPEGDRLIYYRKEVTTSELKSSEIKLNYNVLQKVLQGKSISSKKRNLSTVAAEVDGQADQIVYYISLNQLCKYMNSRILSNIGRSYTREIEGEEVTIKGNGKVIRLTADLEPNFKKLCEPEDIYCSNVKSNILKDGVNNPVPGAPLVQNLKSANPMEVILPSEENGMYYEESFVPKDTIIDGIEIKNRFRLTSNKEPYQCHGKCTLINLGEILISIDSVVEIFDSLSDKQDVPLNQAISSLFDRIFNLISKHTGGIYQLTMVTREFNEITGDSNTSDIKDIKIINTIIDKNFTGCTEIEPYNFTPRVHKSLMRSFSMSSKLPSATQTAMYAGGRTKISQNVASQDAFSKLQQRYLGGCGPSKTTPKTNTTSGTNTTTTTPPATANITSIGDWKTRLEVMLKLMGDNGSNDAYVAEMQRIMRRLKSNPDEFSEELKDVAGSWIGRTIYPLQFQLTVDGISGFRFGNVVSCDWLPAKYRYKTEGSGKKGLIVTFVVTKVSHQISGYDWTTTLETQCRVGTPK